MRNALICLFIVSIIAIIPITPVAKSTITPILADSQILYSSEASQYLISKNNQSEVEKAVVEAETNGVLLDGKTIGFINNPQHLFIQAKKDANQIYVYYIFEYIE